MEFHARPWANAVLFLKTSSLLCIKIERTRAPGLARIRRIGRPLFVDVMNLESWILSRNQHTHTGTKSLTRSRKRFALESDLNLTPKQPQTGEWIQRGREKKDKMVKCKSIFPQIVQKFSRRQKLSVVQWSLRMQMPLDSTNYKIWDQNEPFSRGGDALCTLHRVNAYQRSFSSISWCCFVSIYEFVCSHVVWTNIYCVAPCCTSIPEMCACVRARARPHPACW